MKTDISSSDWPIIKCPHCGYEYLPCEIFLPEDHIGKVETVVKDALGKILYIEYEEDAEPDREESFVCEGCGKEFIVKPETSYSPKKQEEELDFTSDSSLI